MQPTVNLAQRQKPGRAPKILVSAMLAIIGFLLATMGFSTSAAAQGVAPGALDVDVRTSCLSGSGRVDVDLRNITDVAADYSVTVGTVGPRVGMIAGDSSRTVTVTGRPEGLLAITVSSDAVIAPFSTTQNVRIACVAPRDIFEAETSCLAGLGRVDAWLTGQPTILPVPGPMTNWTVSLHRLDASTGLELLNPLIRELVLPAGHGPTRVSITGRADGPYIVRASSASVEYPELDPIDYSARVEVDCIIDRDSRISSVCLSGNGRVNVVLNNNREADVGNYEVTVGTLDPRSLTLQPGRSGRVSVTGRSDGFLDVTVTRNGQPYLFKQLDIVCDVLGTRISVVYNPGPNADPAYPIGLLPNVLVTIKTSTNPSQNLEYTTGADGRVVVDDLPTDYYRFFVTYPIPNNEGCWYRGQVSKVVSGSFTDVVIETDVECS